MPAKKRTSADFEPDYAVPPGATLLETITALGIDQKELAFRLHTTESRVSQIIIGRAALSDELANKLELVTGVPARIWNRLELHYRERLFKFDGRKNQGT